MNTITNRLNTDRNLLRPTTGRIAADAVADLLEPLIQGALLLSLVGALLASGYHIAAPAPVAVDQSTVAQSAVAPAPVTRSL